MLTKAKLFIIIGIVILFSGLVSLYFFWNPSEHHFFPKCPFYSMTNLYCPGCGSQRAIHQIMNGQIANGFRHNYLLLIVVLVLGYKLFLLALNKIFKTSYTDIFHKSWVVYFLLILVIAFWIFRNINIFPFTELAP